MVRQISPMSNVLTSLGACLLLACLGACGDLTNPPVTGGTLTESVTFTLPKASAGDIHKLTLSLAENELIAFRAWSTGVLFGVDVTITAPGDADIWTGISRGAEIRVQGVRAPVAGEYTVEVKWLEGAGVSSYRYHRLSEATPTLGNASWSDPLATPRAGHTMTRLADGKMLIVGGHEFGSGFKPGRLDTLATAELADPDNGGIIRVDDLLQGRAYHAAVLIADDAAEEYRNKVFIAGGLGSTGEALLTTELFDPETRTFAPGPILPEPRAFLTALAVGEAAPFLAGKIIIGGGERTRRGPQHDKATLAYSEVDENPKDLWLFDVTPEGGDSITALVQLNVGRLYPTFTVLSDSRILIIGGGVDDFPTVSGCEQTVDNTCICSQGLTVCTEYTNCDADGACTVRSYTRKDIGTREVEVYDTQTNTITTLDSKLARGRLGHSATLLVGDQVLIAGGSTAARRAFWPNEITLPESPATLDSVELFEPETNSFRVLPGLSLPRAHHRAIRLGDGSLYLVGGLTSVPGGIESVSLIERFDPILRRFVAQDTLDVGYLAPAIAAVADGSGFVITGGEVDGEPTADARRINIAPVLPAQ
ncbi:MAG: hypothetical protein ACI9OJ_004291 [Myxococcota bacterium]|jgi:hypothetical protein